MSRESRESIAELSARRAQVKAEFAQTERCRKKAAALGLRLEVTPRSWARYPEQGRYALRDAETRRLVAYSMDDLDNLERFLDVTAHRRANGPTPTPTRRPKGTR